MNSTSMKFPVISNDGGLGAYLDQIKKLRFSAKSKKIAPDLINSL